MALKDNIYTIKELQGVVVCGMDISKHWPLDTSGTIGQFLDMGKSNKLDLWNNLWMAMQLFDERHNRFTALECILKANAIAGVPDIDEFHETISDLLDFFNGEDVCLQSRNEQLKLYDLVNRNKYESDYHKLIIKSCRGATDKDYKKSCPLVLYFLRPIVGFDALEKLVRDILEVHP